MSLQSLGLRDFRCIESADLDLHGRCNLISGENASGKTSLLEAIFFLGRGRSFRTARNDTLVRKGASELLLTGRVARGDRSMPLGIRFGRAGMEAKGGGERIGSLAELASILPVQAIDPEVHRLVEEGPQERRRYLDWGVFHVEHAFHRVWLDVHRCLRQRNALLRHDRIPAEELGIWDGRLAESAAQLDELRARYFDAFYPVFQQTLRELVNLQGLELGYLRGWERDKPLAAVLAEQLERDRLRGFTHSGPHRADIRVRIRGLNAAEVLSRGQQKLVVAAMKLAQGRLFSATQGRDCVFLVDDLPAELDREHRRQLCQLLGAMRCQVLLSCVDAAELSGCWDGLSADEMRLFHVEHGALSAAN